MTIHLTPVNSTIFVTREPGAEKVGSIHTAEKWRRPSEVATVYCSAVEGYTPGDRVVLGRFSGENIQIGDLDVWVVREDEIRAVLPPEVDDDQTAEYRAVRPDDPAELMDEMEIL